MAEVVPFPDATRQDLTGSYQGSCAYNSMGEGISDAQQKRMERKLQELAERFLELSNYLARGALTLIITSARCALEGRVEAYFDEEVDAIRREFAQIEEYGKTLMADLSEGQSMTFTAVMTMDKVTDDDEDEEEDFDDDPQVAPEDASPPTLH